MVFLGQVERLLLRNAKLLFAFCVVVTICWFHDNFYDSVTPKYFPVFGYFQCMAMDGVVSVDGPPLLGETCVRAFCGIECQQPVPFPPLQLYQVLLLLGMIFLLLDDTVQEAVTSKEAAGELKSSQVKSSQ